jgi:hypothetical protein
MAIEFETFDVGAQRKLVETAIGLFLQDLGDGLQAPSARQATAVDHAIAALRHGEYERALTYICAEEGATSQCGSSPTSANTTKRAPSLRELWRRFVGTRALA